MRGPYGVLRFLKTAFAPSDPPHCRIADNLPVSTRHVTQKGVVNHYTGYPLGSIERETKKAVVFNHVLFRFFTHTEEESG
jgi:hypothetical protein